MYNNDSFIYVMDKINSIAKSKDYQNGIAWANKALDNGIIGQYDHSAFDGCHHLRNLIAHGFARDIKITDETLNIAKTFFSCITGAEPAAGLGGSKVLANTPRVDPDAFLKAGDYYVVRRRDFPLYHHSEYAKVYRYGRGDVPRGLDEYACIYVLRPTVPIVEKRKGIFCIISKDDFTVDAKGRQFVSVKFIQSDHSPSVYKDCVYDNIKCEIYLARPECFNVENPFPLHVGPESQSAYISFEKPWQAPTEFSPQKNGSRVYGFHAVKVEDPLDDGLPF